MLYQLSYSRNFNNSTNFRLRIAPSMWAMMDSNHRRYYQQIYSLPHLATLVIAHNVSIPLFYFANNQQIEPSEGFEPTTPRLQITCSDQLSYEGKIDTRFGSFQSETGANLGIFSELQKLLFFFFRLSCFFFQLMELF